MQVRLATNLQLQISKVGFPIRKFSDQSPFAAPRNLSQRTTSFIASQRQGIHQLPLRHLIALIIDAHPSTSLGRERGGLVGCCSDRLDRYLKTSFASNISGNNAVKPVHDWCTSFRPPPRLGVRRQTSGHVSSSRCEITRARTVVRGEIFSGRATLGECHAFVRSRRMRSIRPVSVNAMHSLAEQGRLSAINHLVEPDGIEPTTSCLQSTRSPN